MIKNPLTIRYLSGHDVTRLALDNDEILDAIEASLRAQTAGDGVVAVIDYFDPLIAAFERDRSLAPDVETILEHFSKPAFTNLYR
jgi:hypothetical protein